MHSMPNGSSLPPPEHRRRRLSITRARALESSGGSDCTVRFVRYESDIKLRKHSTDYNCIIYQWSSNTL